MVVGIDDQEAADLVFHALADRTRRGILAEVLVHPVSVSSLARGRPMSFAAVQKHVAVLERAGLVSKRRQGREQLVRGEVEVVRDAMRLLGELERQWRLRLDRFAALLGDPVEPVAPVDPAGPVDPAEPPHRTDHTGEGDRP